MDNWHVEMLDGEIVYFDALVVILFPDAEMSDGVNQYAGPSPQRALDALRKAPVDHGAVANLELWELGTRVSDKYAQNANELASLVALLKGAQNE